MPNEPFEVKEKAKMIVYHIQEGHVTDEQGTEKILSLIRSLAEGAMVSVPLMPLIEGGRTCKTHADYKCGECNSWNEAHCSLVEYFRTKGIEVK